MKKYEFHAAANIFPLNDKGPEFQGLVEDIKRNGLRHPIVLHEGKILDGRRRYLACRKAGVRPKFLAWDGKGSPVDYVISVNVHRRHLTPSQRAFIGLDLMAEEEAKAKERQRLSRGRGRKGAQSCTTSPGKAAEWAAKRVGVSPRMVRMAKRIKEAQADLVPQIRAGKITVNEAYKATGASVQSETEPTGQTRQCIGIVGGNGKLRGTFKNAPQASRSITERGRRRKATTLICGDCRKEMKKIANESIDAIICDPIYPEVDREYGRITEQHWHELIKGVVRESRRVLKPKGSAVFILQPNYERIGKMRMWLWEFVAWAGREWNVVQDAYWWAVDALPLAGTDRKYGLMRQSTKMCVWLGSPDCYRNQEAVLWTPSQAMSAKHRDDTALRTGPSGRTYRTSTIAKAVDERGGTTPLNLLPIPSGNRLGGAEHHAAATPYDVAAWWTRYILPPDGVLLDPMCGSGTMLVAGLDNGASRVTGIDKKQEYLEIARRRFRNG